jgi:hypothetical protein
MFKLMFRAAKVILGAIYMYIYVYICVYKEVQLLSNEIARAVPNFVDLE